MLPLGFHTTRIVNIVLSSWVYKGVHPLVFFSIFMLIRFDWNSRRFFLFFFLMLAIIHTLIWFWCSGTVEKEVYIIHFKMFNRLNRMVSFLFGCGETHRHHLTVFQQFFSSSSSSSSEHCPIWQWWFNSIHITCTINHVRFFSTMNKHMCFVVVTLTIDHWPDLTKTDGF